MKRKQLLWGLIIPFLLPMLEMHGQTRQTTPPPTINGGLAGSVQVITNLQLTEQNMRELQNLDSLQVRAQTARQTPRTAGRQSGRQAVRTPPRVTPRTPPRVTPRATPRPGGAVNAARGSRGPLSTRTETNRLVSRGVRPRTPAPRAGKAGNNALSWKVDLDRPILLLKPGQATVAVGDTFTLAVQLSNPRNIEFDRLAVTLSYDRYALEALEIDDSSLAGALDPLAPPVKELAQAGRLSFTARLAEPVNWSRRELIAIRFRARQSAPHAAVEFLNGAGETMLLNGEKVVLGESKGDFDRATLDASVTVRPGGAAGAASVFGWSFDNEVRALTRRGGTANSFATLALSAEKQSVMVGEVFDVQILIDNPDSLPLELIRVALRFDPQLLRVIDTDADNVIQQGININDGPYRASFPFDSHLRNSVDNDRGRIAYAVATMHPRLLATRGRLATIRFQALAATDFAPIWFDQDAQGAITSEALARGVNVLLRPSDLRPSVRGLILRVQPGARLSPASRLEE